MSGATPMVSTISRLATVDKYDERQVKSGTVPEIGE
jgi:hypothetical protein